MNTTTKPKHIGRNISRIRELRDMKQDALAMAMGVSQQTISNIENSESIDEDKLQMVAIALGVSAEAIKNFSEEAVMNFAKNNNANITKQNYKPEEFERAKKVMALTITAGSLMGNLILGFLGSLIGAILFGKKD